MKAKLMKTLSPSGGGRGRKYVNVCKELLLAMEVDGCSHLLEETIVKDNYLEKKDIVWVY